MSSKISSNTPYYLKQNPKVKRIYTYFKAIARGAKKDTTLGNALYEG
jgi:hypothetical protein